jgi:hypothetical protein
MTRNITNVFIFIHLTDSMKHRPFLRNWYSLRAHTGPYPEPGESSPYSQTLFLHFYIFMLLNFLLLYMGLWISPSLCVWLPGILNLSVFSWLPLTSSQFIQPLFLPIILSYKDALLMTTFHFNYSPSFSSFTQDPGPSPPSPTLGLLFSLTKAADLFAMLITLH